MVITKDNYHDKEKALAGAQKSSMLKLNGKLNLAPKSNFELYYRE